MSDTRIPIIRQADVIVIGGASGGVAAAVAAAEAGSRVFLGAAESYLGEDICSTGRFWLSPGGLPSDTPLARAIFAGAREPGAPPVRPMHVKRTLDEALIAARVDFLFGCHPADLLVDGAGAVAGVVFASRTGLFAVLGRVALDATPHALLARLAGVKFTPWPAAPIRFTRLLAGHRAAGDEVEVGRRLPGVFSMTVKDVLQEAEVFAYDAQLPVASFTPAAFAEAEQTLRDRFWHRDVIWSSERAGHLPPAAVGTAAVAWKGAATVDLSAFATPVPGLHVLGACAALARDDAAKLMDAPQYMLAGARLGTAAAAAAQARTVAGACRPMHGRRVAGVREANTCARFESENLGWINGPAGGNLPELGDFDVVVAGGGTAGAPAALAAARAGARVLLLEALHAPGGVGTLGHISIYWYGCRDGFTHEIDDGLAALAGEKSANRNAWNSEHKSEWLRREIRKAGGAIWYGSVVSGAVVAGRRVRGVVVNTPWGRGVVRAGMVVDATGNADVAAAAGAACVTVSDRDLAVQGSGLPPRPFRPAYVNTDYTFIEDSDPVDFTRAFVVGRRKFAAAFDLGALADSRERRQIIGDVTVTPVDAYTGRTWSDSICRSRSNFDSHGFTVDPMFLVTPPDHTALDAWLPLRALLPRGFSGVLVTGLAISAQRDVMPVLRMQPDVQNHGYAAGLAAAMALACKGDARRITMRDLQRRLVEKGILPGMALLQRDAGVSAAAAAAAMAGGLRLQAEVAAAFARPAAVLPVLRAQLANATDDETRLRHAKLLAMLGDAAGEDVLIAAVAGSAWDTGWNYTGMGQFGRSLSPLDDCLVALANLRSVRAVGAVRAKIAALGPADAFSHSRAAALFCESLAEPSCAAPLAALLRQPGVSGHAWTDVREELASIPVSPVDTSTRNAALRELYLARALYRCGDCDGLAAAILGRYARDIRGHFARHARRVLARA